VALVRIDVSEKYHLHHQGDNNWRSRNIVNAGVPKSPILIMLLVGTIRFSETSVPTRVTRGNIAENGSINQFICLHSL
jgi:hypothetical protein